MSWGTHDRTTAEANLEAIVLLLVSLASGRTNDARLGEIAPRERQQGMFDSVRAFLAGESGRQPVVLLIDDLQWIDAASEALLHYLASRIDTQRLLIVACARPEYQPAWSHGSSVVPVALRPLAAEERQRMIETMSDAALTPVLAAEVAQRSEGNPFFLEELLRALSERFPTGVDTDASGDGGHLDVIPATVEGIITAKIDRLDERLKRVLQIASILGREFDFDLLRAVAGVGDELREAVSGLVDMELLRETAIFPTWTFAFKSALVHEVAYRTMLLARRRELHAEAARAVERRSVQLPEESYELMAYHLSRSLDAEAAVRYLLLAGDKAVANFALVDARRYFDAAAEKLSSLSAATTAALAADLHRHRQRLHAAEVDSA